MHNKLSTRFFLKGNKKDKQGTSPIYLRITVNGDRAEVSTNKKTTARNWNQIAGRVSGNEDINTWLNNLLTKVERIFLRLDMKEERITVGQIVDELRGKGVTQMTLFQTYNYHITCIEKLSGIDYSPSTLVKYKASFSSIKIFLNNKDIRLCDLKYKFVEDYHSFLRTTYKLQNNSASNNIKHLFRIMNISIINKWISINPFKGFSCRYIAPVKQYLTQAEINTIYKKTFKIERLNKVRDCFIFQIYTGLAFSDMQNLNKNNIEIGVDRKEWIVINRIKTGERSAIPLLPRALEMLNKYDYKLPVSSNQKTNAYLKEIADLCGISKKLTTHTGRHTFATQLLSQGIPFESVSKLLGHSSLKSTAVYAKITDRKISVDLKPLMKSQPNQIKKRKRD